jgi:hypothetical protein
MAAAPHPVSGNPSAAEAARPQLLVAVAMMLEGLHEPATALAVLGSLRPGDMRSGGARVPGTSYELPAATAARAMRDLLAQRGGAADALLAALAEADVAARMAALKGIDPPVLASLYAHCRPSIAGNAETLLTAMQRLYRAAAQLFTVTQLRRIDAQCQAWLADPASLDATPVQQFVARFVRNCP